MKPCSNCGELASDEAIFCSKCGNQFNEFKLPVAPQADTPPAIPPQQTTTAPVQIPQMLLIQQPPIPIKYETRVVFYQNEFQMQNGIASWAKGGWEVVSTEVVEQGYSASKTCCLGALFLPLALLGKKGNHHKVMYRRAI